MKRIFSLALPLLFLAQSVPAAETELLSYWSFNNCEKPTEAALGQWRTEPALYGEVFDAQQKRLSSNTNFNTVFHDENIYLDFSSLGGSYGGTVSRSWGVFVDTRANKLKQDDTQGGSFMTGAVNDSSEITFVLSTEGYKDLVMSYAHRANDAAVIQWSWSVDGSDFKQFAEVNRHTAFSPEVLNLSGEGGLGLTELNDQKTIYLRATFLFPGKPSGNIAIDNFQLTGSR